jgi:hypothetical protein
MLVLLCIGVSVAMAGCQGEPEPTDPEGSYRLFQQALEHGDESAMWRRLDSQTKAYFADRYRELESMDAKIRRYLPATDHEVARNQSGTTLLNEIDGGEELFARVARPDRVAMTPGRRVGRRVESITVSKDEKSAVVETLAGQTFRMTKGEEGEWYVNLVASNDSIHQSFAWLRNNSEALDETVDHLVDREQQRRERVIADLFDVE